VVHCGGITWLWNTLCKQTVTQSPVSISSDTIEYWPWIQVTNTAIRERTRFTMSHSRQTSFYIHCHICNLPTYASEAVQLSAKVLAVTVPGTAWNHPPGNSLRSWLQHIQEDTGLSIQLVSFDHTLWRTLRPSAGQAQQWVNECDHAKILHRLIR